MQQPYRTAACLNTDHLQPLTAGAVSVQFDARQITHFGRMSDRFRHSGSPFAQTRAFAIVNIALKVIRALTSSHLSDLGQFITAVPLQPLARLQLQLIAAGIEQLVQFRARSFFDAAIAVCCYLHGQCVIHRPLMNTLQQIARFIVMVGFAVVAPAAAVGWAEGLPLGLAPGPMTAWQIPSPWLRSTDTACRR